MPLTLPKARTIASLISSGVTAPEASSSRNALHWIVFVHVGPPLDEMEGSIEEMTKYEELARLASKQAQSSVDEEKRCQLAAMQLTERLREYLDAPEHTFATLNLDHDMRTIGEPQPLGSWPELMQDKDGFWCFCLQMHFAAEGQRAFNRMRLKIGLRSPEEGKLIIWHVKTFDVSTAEDLAPFFKYIYDSLLESFTEPHDGRRGRPGFIS